MCVCVCVWKASCYNQAEGRWTLDSVSIYDSVVSALPRKTFPIPFPSFIPLLVISSNQSVIFFFFVSSRFFPPFFPLLRFMKHLRSLISSSSSSSQPSWILLSCPSPTCYSIHFNPRESWPAVLCPVLFTPWLTRHFKVRNKTCSHLNLTRTATRMHCTAFWWAIGTKTTYPVATCQTHRLDNYCDAVILETSTIFNYISTWDSEEHVFIPLTRRWASCLLIPSSQPCPINMMPP